MAITNVATDTLADYLDLQMPARSRKPRQRGLTMVMDQGWPVDFTAGMLAQFGAYLDIAKFWDPHLQQPREEVARKVAVYREHDVLVQPGGMMLEIARRQGNAVQVLEKLHELGFNACEISSTAETRSDIAPELELVTRAREMGFTVFGEVGRKFADGDETRLTDEVIDIETTVAEFKALLDAGASHVYWEGHLLRRVLGDDPETIKARAGFGVWQVMEVAKAVGVENIIFEASGLRPRANRQWLQFWYVRLFGPEVNIGNARIEELANLEAIRAGNHPIFGFGSSGNYAWVRSVAEDQVGGSDKWWRS